MREIFIATLNAGKLHEFTAMASAYQVAVSAVPGIASLPPVREEAPTFAANACEKAEQYSRHVKAGYVLADDSGLEVFALGGAPGVRSARYAASSGGELNSTDDANNALLLQQMHDVPNVFVVDGSAFTTATEKNPTLTILSLAWRATDYLAGEMKSSRL